MKAGKKKYSQNNNVIPIANSIMFYCLHVLLRMFLQVPLDMIPKYAGSAWNEQGAIRLRGNCTSDQKLACSVLYLKIISAFFFFLKK